MPEPSSQLITPLITGFLEEIGITVTFASISEQTFLPGLTIRQGFIILDEFRLSHPGDLLHEAGHLALLTPEQRRSATAPIDPDGGMELGAIAWSWAALTYLGLDPKVVFHPDGYRGGSQTIIDSFSQGRTFGVPILQWLGLTNAKMFPEMICWLRPTAGPASDETPGLD